MEAVTVMIKPSSSNCNMRCKYCFYFDEANKREIPSHGFMQPETMEKIIEKVIEMASEQCNFFFQGGEPTLIGLDYFKQFIDCVNKYNEKGVEVHYSLQTNGYVIDHKWAEFFAKYNFLVGISLDGNKDIHDLHRIDAQGQATYKRIMKGIQILNAHKVEFNILSVITAQSAREIVKNYRFFSRNNFLWQQYIPCLDPVGEERGNASYSITPEIYSQALKKLFDLWHQDIMNDKIVSIRFFDNLVGMLLQFPPESCGMAGICSIHYVFEADGSAYPCDFYMLDEFCLGNINFNSFEELDIKRKELRFVEKSKKVDNDCKVCKWYQLCRGGCRRDRDDFASEELTKTYLCKSYQEFFEYAYPRLCEIASKIANRQE